MEISRTANLSDHALRERIFGEVLVLAQANETGETSADTMREKLAIELDLPPHLIFTSIRLARMQGLITSGGRRSGYWLTPKGHTRLSDSEVEQ